MDEEIDIYALSLVVVLNACTSIAWLERGKHNNKEIVRRMENNEFVNDSESMDILLIECVDQCVCCRVSAILKNQCLSMFVHVE